MSVNVAYLGTEVIDSFETFWKHQISDENLGKMKRFGIAYPEAASHRWSLVAGPCPWFPGDGEEEKLKLDPKYSAFDLFGLQNEAAAHAMRKRCFVIISLIVMVLLASVSLIALARAKKRAESLGCASSIVSVCHGGLLWAQDHGGYFPTNFLMASNEIVTPQVLSCDRNRRVRSWAEFTPAHSTYEIVTPGVHEDATNAVFIRCTIHGHLGYPDRTVFDGVRRRGKFE